MRRLSFTPNARADLAGIYRQSSRQFGVGARDRYRKLVTVALVRLQQEPEQPTARRRPELDHVWTYHLRHANRDLPVRDRVAEPRHLIVYEADERAVQVLRVLHDAMDLSRHEIGTNSEEPSA